jgi:hypothetical protein
LIAIHSKLRTENCFTMKSANPWITYRTRFLVKAKQLSASLTFTDALGRIHSGRKGDYLVEWADGVLRIAPRQIFEDIYVGLLAGETSEQSCAQSDGAPPPQQIFLTETSRKKPVVSIPAHLSNKTLSFRAEQHHSRSE